MSDHQLNAFIARLKEDSNLRSMLDAENADPVEIAKSFGFVIPSANHYHFSAKSPDPAGLLDEESFAELSDDDVEGISGGGGGSVCKCLSRAFR